MTREYSLFVWQRQTDGGWCAAGTVVRRLDWRTGVRL